MGRLEQNWSCVLYLGFSISSSVPAQKPTFQVPIMPWKQWTKSYQSTLLFFILHVKKIFFVPFILIISLGIKKKFFCKSSQLLEAARVWTNSTWSRLKLTNHMTRSTSEWNFHFLLVSEVSATQIRQRSKVPLLANVFLFFFFFNGWLLQNLWITLDNVLLLLFHWLTL